MIAYFPLPGLMSMHTLWLRQHNRLATRLGKINNWDATRIYQETRKIIGAQLQVVTYNEFLPLILGDQTVRSVPSLLSRFTVVVVILCPHFISLVTSTLTIPFLLAARRVNVIFLWEY